MNLLSQVQQYSREYNFIQQLAHKSPYLANLLGLAANGYSDAAGLLFNFLINGGIENPSGAIFSTAMQFGTTYGMRRLFRHFYPRGEGGGGYQMRPPIVHHKYLPLGADGIVRYVNGLPAAGNRDLLRADHAREMYNDRLLAYNNQVAQQNSILGGKTFSSKALYAGGTILALTTLNALLTSDLSYITNLKEKSHQDVVNAVRMNLTAWEALSHLYTMHFGQNEDIIRLFESVASPERKYDFYQSLENTLKSKPDLGTNASGQAKQYAGDIMSQFYNFMARPDAPALSFGLGIALNELTKAATDGKNIFQVAGGYLFPEKKKNNVGVHGKTNVTNKTHFDDQRDKDLQTPWQGLPESKRIGFRAEMLEKKKRGHLGIKQYYPAYEYDTYGARIKRQLKRAGNAGVNLIKNTGELISSTIPNTINDKLNKKILDDQNLDILVDHMQQQRKYEPYNKFANM